MKNRKRGGIGVSEPLQSQSTAKKSWGERRPFAGAPFVPPFEAQGKQDKRDKPHAERSRREVALEAGGRCGGAAAAAGGDRPRGVYALVAA